MYKSDYIFSFFVYKIFSFFGNYQNNDQIDKINNKIINKNNF